LKFTVTLAPAGTVMVLLSKAIFLATMSMVTVWDGGVAGVVVVIGGVVVVVVGGMDVIGGVVVVVVGGMDVIGGVVVIDVGGVVLGGGVVEAADVVGDDDEQATAPTASRASRVTTRRLILSILFFILSFLYGGLAAANAAMPTSPPRIVTGLPDRRCR
jgi:hypothetical protein